ncbi:MAG: type 1 glutamine amidotransferase domain-containing protein [Bacteroidota bacterium]
MDIKKVLFVTTSHDKLGNTGEKTGVWLEELASPYFVFRDAGTEVTIASPLGGQVPLDPKSQLKEWQTDATRRFEYDDKATKALANSIQLSDISADGYDAIFLPGGHGPMWDLGNNPELSILIEEFNLQGKLIGAVCHGVVGLIGAETKNGSPLVNGVHLTSFTNTEESVVGLTEVVPFLLETELVSLGAVYSKAEDFEPYTVTHNNIITGQNPASSVVVAEQMLKHQFATQF